MSATDHRLQIIRCAYHATNPKNELDHPYHSPGGLTEDTTRPGSGIPEDLRKSRSVVVTKRMVVAGFTPTERRLEAGTQSALD